MKNQPTPLEKLVAEQRRVRAECRVQEQKLNEDVQYIHRHSGRLLVAGISSLFFPDRGKEQTVPPVEGESSFHLDSLWKRFSPLFWEVAVPALVSWGMGQLGKWFHKGAGDKTNI